MYGIFIFLIINFLGAAVLFYIGEWWSIAIGVFLCVEALIYFVLWLRKRNREPSA